MMPQENRPLPTSITGPAIIAKIRRRRLKRQVGALVGGVCTTLMFSYMITTQYETTESTPAIQLVSQSEPNAQAPVEKQTPVLPHDDHHRDVYERSFEWLSKEQLPTGAWNVEKWEGKAQFQVGISAMATIAIMNLDQPSNSSTINKALAYLFHEQNEDGSFGPPFLGDLYNQSLGTLAFRLAKERGFNLPQQALTKAQSFLERYRVGPRQWAYRKGLEPEKNLSAWANLAMEETTLHEELNSHLTQLESHSSTFLASNSPSESKRPRPVSPMEMFLKTHSQTLDPAQWEQDILTHQIRQGDLAGSWPIEGPWSHVGGRIFTTSIALLSLRRNVI